MEKTKYTSITVEAFIEAPIHVVWKLWNDPKHITQWCYASNDWHAPHAENDLKVGGKFTTTMAAKDGSVSFDFGGTYSEVQLNKLISYEMQDGRAVHIAFSEKEGKTIVVENFDAEETNALEIQRDGWQAILNNFKKHVESQNK